MSIETLSDRQFEELRASYAYIPARLVRSSTEVEPSIAHAGAWFKPYIPPAGEWARKEGRRQYSSIELDTFHRGLLVSDQSEDVVHGVLSIVFWGNASGKKGRTHPAFALERARWLVRGKKIDRAPPCLTDTISALREAHHHLDRGAPEDALTEVMRIKGLGMSFGSKVLTFMDPAKAAVYDKVIASRLQSDLRIDRKLVINPARSCSLKLKSDTYGAWCSYCASKARHLNELGSRWSDWDGKRHEWRAVDIERAVYAVT